PQLHRSGLLREAVASVVAPPGTSIEHWVIDGNSTDDTLTWLREAPGIQWMSEPDRGLYDALNKGLARATGEIIGFINSDDLFVSESLPVIIDAFADPAVDVVSGHVEFFRNAEFGGRQTLRIMQDEPALRLDL